MMTCHAGTGSVSRGGTGGYSNVYPSGGQAMQFTGLYHATAATDMPYGLYYATHDPAAYYKIFSCQGDTYNGE